MPWVIGLSKLAYPDLGQPSALACETDQANERAKQCTLARVPLSTRQ